MPMGSRVKTIDASCCGVSRPLPWSMMRCQSFPITTQSSSEGLIKLIARINIFFRDTDRWPGSEKRISRIAFFENEKTQGRSNNKRDNNYITFSNSLIIHEEKTKEITTVKEVWICDPNYHKIRRSFALIFSKNYQCFEKLYQTRGRVFHQISKHFEVG